MDEAVSYINQHCPDIEGIVAIPLAAMPFGTLLAYKLNKPFYILRKEPKKHGLGKMLEGELKKGQKILLVDDLISSGFSKAPAINALRDEGAKVDNLFVFTQNHSNPLFPLLITHFNQTILDEGFKLP